MSISIKAEGLAVCRSGAFRRGGKTSVIATAHQSGKSYFTFTRSRQLPVLPRVDIPANSPQGQTLQRSDKLQKNPKNKKQNKSYRPQLAVWLIWNECQETITTQKGCSVYFAHLYGPLYSSTYERMNSCSMAC